MKECIKNIITFIIIIVISFIIGYELVHVPVSKKECIKKRDTIELQEIEDMKEYSSHSELTI